MRLGAHMSIEGGKYKALERGKQLNCDSIQLFIRSVRSWNAKPLEQKEIDNFIEKRKELNSIWPVISHNSYLINLASLDEEKLAKSYDAMLDELNKAILLGIEYENIHPGVIPKKDKNNITKEEAFDQIIIHLNRLIEATNKSKII